MSRELPAGLRQGDIDFLGKVMPVKVLFSYNFKCCQRAQTFPQGPLKLTCVPSTSTTSYSISRRVSLNLITTPPHPPPPLQSKIKVDTVFLHSNYKMNTK
jgi:hypothetical protein